jgi:hypothetical protein
VSARILNVTEGQYLADPCARPSLSQSIATTLLLKSPLHAWLEHPRLGGQRKKPTKAMDEGTLIHRVLLGTGAPLQIIDVADYRTKLAQEARDAALERGALPVKKADYEEAVLAAAAINMRIENEFGIKLNGASEIAIEWIEHATSGAEVICRCRLDHVWTDTGLILDVKRAEVAHPKTLPRKVSDYGYEVQHAAYTRALAALSNSTPEMVFLFVETDEPYSVVPAKLSATFKTMGERRWQRAIDIWAECVATKKWPGYVREAVTIEPTPWALAEAEEYGQ